MVNFWIDLTHLFYDLLLEPLGVMGMIYSYAPIRMILPMQLFTQDSLSNSLRYVIRHLGIPLPERETQKVGGIAKYSFFISISLIYYFLHILTWMNLPSQLLYYLISFISSPGLVELLLRQFPFALDTLEFYRKRLINYMGCLVLSKIINFICFKNLGQDPHITEEELGRSITAQNKVYFWSFIKIFLLTSLIKYLEKNGYYYSLIIKILHNWGTLIEVPKYHRSMILDSQTLHPRNTISSIIKRRKWSYFYDPTVLNMLIRIYNEKNGNFLEEFIFHFNRSFLQFLTMWTLAFYIPIPLMSLLFRIPHFNFLKWNILFIPSIITILWWYYHRNIIYLSLLSEFGGYLDNPAIRHILRVIWEIYLPKGWTILCHYHKYNFYLLASLPIVYVTGSQSNWIYLCILPFVAKYNFIYIWLGILGFFSNYDPYHLATLNIILYLIVNLADYKNISKSFTLNGIHKINEVEIISSYWPGLKNKNPKKTVSESVPIQIQDQSLELSTIMIPHYSY